MKFGKLSLTEAMEKCSKYRSHREDDLQKSCRKWFDLQHPRYRQLMHHSPNEGELIGGSKAGAKRKDMGVRAGFPDFIFLLPNGYYPYLCLELKTKEGRQSDSQKEFQRKVEEVGGKYVVIRTLDDFIKEVNQYIEDTTWI